MKGLMATIIAREQRQAKRIRSSRKAKLVDAILDGKKFTNIEAIIRDFSPCAVGITCVSESQNANQSAIDRTRRAILA